MTHSLSTHGALTEDVCKNVSGKGREGNKEGKGVRGETPTTSSLSYPRRTADEVVCATRQKVGAA